MEKKPRYRRVLLKLSGEALMGDIAFGISPETMFALAKEIARVHALGVEIGIVVGGGNIFRGIAGAAKGLDRTRADYMGMLATVINSLALQDTLEFHKISARVLSALEIQAVAEPYVRARAIRHLEKGRVVIFAAGTGSPFFTTDTAAALRALEIKAEVLFKATKVDGVYSADPLKDPTAKRFDFLSYDEVLERGLRVMDATAISLAKEYNLPVLVFNMQQPGNIIKAICGESVGTLVGRRDHEGTP